MAEKITDQLVKRLPSPPDGNKITYDGEIKGFGVRTTAGGAKAFILNYRASGRERRLTIGAYPDWSVAAARERAKELKREVDLGRDPMGERHEHRAAPTVIELYDRYVTEHLPRKSPRAQADDRSMFQKYVLPALGKMKVAEVKPADIDALHKAVTARGQYRANRVIEVLRKAFNLAIRWEWRIDNPCIGVARNPEEKRTRYLTPAEIARLTAALAAQPDRVSAKAVRFLMLTGARRGEALNARWSQFDLEAGVWVKPAASTKQRREHRVPLSEPAIELLKSIKETKVIGDYVFAGKDGKPITDLKRMWAGACRAAGIEGVRLHDLRHAYASILASAGLSLPIIGALLGHTQANTTARYSHLFDDPLRQATDHVAGVINGVDQMKIAGRAR
jgi:integrase